MAGYKVTKVSDIDNYAKAPAEMRMLRDVIGSDQIALSYRLFPAGYRPSHGHTHTKIDEIVYIIRGELEIKLDDDVIKVGPKTVVKIGPEVKRGYHNHGKEDVEAIVVSLQGNFINDNGGKPDPDWWTD